MNIQARSEVSSSLRRQTRGHSPPLTVYYGLRRFLLIAESFSLDRQKRPYRRLSATLIVARKTPVRLHFGPGRVLSGQALLIAPGVARQKIVGVGSEVAIFDVSVGTPAFHVLQPSLEPGGVRVFDINRFATLEPLLDRAFQGPLPDDEAARLFTAGIGLAKTDPAATADPLDARVRRALDIIDSSPFDELRPQALAAAVGLSASRLRHLFREQLGCPLTRYQRWAATWKAAVLMTQATSLTELAHQIGFYDLAHFDHAFIDIFGLSPSDLLDAEKATLVACL